MSCGSPAGSEGLAPPMGQAGAGAQELENYYSQLNVPVVQQALIGSTHNIRFSAVDFDTVEWTSGVITDAAGQTYAINSGNTGNITALTFIYLDSLISTTELQTTTDNTEAVGAGKFMIAVAEDVVDTAKDAQFQVFGSPDSKGLFTAANIAADTITGNEITGNTIDAGHISSLSFSGKTAVFDTGTIGGWTMAAAELSSGSVKIQATAERILLGSATAPMTGTGVFIGKDGTDYEFRAGNPSGQYMHWNGSTLTIAGVLSLATGTFAGSLQANSIEIRHSGGTVRGYIDTTASSLTFLSADETTAIDISNTEVFFAKSARFDNGVVVSTGSIDFGGTEFTLDGDAVATASSGASGDFMPIRYNGVLYVIPLNDP